MDKIHLLGLTFSRSPAPPDCESHFCAWQEQGICPVCTCKVCAGGYLIEEAKAEERAGGIFAPRLCDCVKRAQSRWRLKNAGFTPLLQRCTFASFGTDSAWQAALKEKALAYLQEKSHLSLFIGGQSGAGKTHLCTAICSEILETDPDLIYFPWVMAGTTLKNLITSPPEYSRERDRLIQTHMLFVDDLFKQQVSEADLRLAYEIINYRYNSCLPTIISSERLLSEIRDANGGSGEALAGRIYEMCGKGEFVVEIGRDPQKNWRFHSST